MMIDYLSSFLTLSVFNFLDISNFLHWVYFRFGSLYLCFGLAVYFFFGCFSVDALVIHTTVLDLICFEVGCFFMNSLVIYKYCFGLVLFGMFSTWFSVNDWLLCEWLFLFRCFRLFDVAKGGENHLRYRVFFFFFANLSENIFC